MCIKLALSWRRNARTPPRWLICYNHTSMIASRQLLHTTNRMAFLTTNPLSQRSFVIIFFARKLDWPVAGHLWGPSCPSRSCWGETDTRHSPGTVYCLPPPPASERSCSQSWEERGRAEVGPSSHPPHNIPSARRPPGSQSSCRINPPLSDSIYNSMYNSILHQRASCQTIEVAVKQILGSVTQ